MLQMDELTFEDEFDNRLTIENEREDIMGPGDRHYVKYPGPKPTIKDNLKYGFDVIAGGLYGHRPNIGYAKFPLDENTNLPLPQPDRPLLLTTFGQDSYREKLIIEAMDARGETANAICCKYTLYTTLHLASKTGDFTCVETLVHLGANVNMRAWDGSTPLMLAIVNGYDSIVRLLVGSGADPNLPALRHQHEAEGIRPIEEAVVRALLYPTVGARTIVKLLMWAGAKFDWDAPWVLPLRESVAYKIRVLLDNLDYDLKKEMDGLSRKSRVEIMYKLRTT